MKKPFFSVVIPVYNKSKYIERTINSVLNQTFKEFELILVDDGSTDNSLDIIKSFNDDRIVLIEQENGGPSKARNTGIKSAKGKFITFLDADDEWVSTKLEKQNELHKNNCDIVWSCSGYRIKTLYRQRNFIHPKGGVLENSIDSIIDGLKIWTGTVVIKRDIFKDKRFLFNLSYTNSEDREVWYKLACTYTSIGYIDEVLATYHTDVNNSLTSIAFINSNLSFLSLKNRIKNEIGLLNKQQFDKFSKFINDFNKKAICQIWLNPTIFYMNQSLIKSNIGSSFYSNLKKWSFLPKRLKLIYIKFFCK